MPQTEKFTYTFYFHALTKILGEPRRFFSELPRDMRFKRPLGFLFVSSLFFAGASLVIRMPANPVILGVIYFINAMGMVFIAAGFGYMVMTMIMGRRVTFVRFFSIYALSSGVTLLASWIPFFVWLTEPWKWWLIGTGMRKNFGFKLTHIFSIIGVSISVIILLFWSVLPVISPRGG